MGDSNKCFRLNIEIFRFALQFHFRKMAFFIFAGTLGFMWLMYIWETYLSIRQHKVYVETKEIPSELHDSLDKETFEKSRLYQIDKSKFGFWSSLYGQVESTIILIYGGIPFLWASAENAMMQIGYDRSHEIKQSIMFVILATLFSTVTGLPWSLYSTFVVEEKHGFNKQTIGFFFKDLVKKLVVSMLIALPVTSALIWIIKWGGEHFFIYTWVFSLVVSLFIIMIYHDYIAPIFDRFIVLPDGNLRTSIESLAKRIDFPLSKINVVEGSKRSSHSNAYFFGFYKKKVIVLFDTLLTKSPFEEEEEKKKENETAAETNEEVDNGDNEKSEEVKEDVSTEEEGEKNVEKEEKVSEDSPDEPQKKVSKGCSDDEILAILGHELGHWKCNHMIINLFISQINLLLSFFVFGLLVNNSELYHSFGFYDQQPTLIGLVIVFQFIFSPYNELVGFLMTLLSRRFEFQADEFGKNLGYASQLQSALAKLHKENLGFPVCDKLYSAYHYSHPPLLERLRALKEKQD